MITLYTAIVEPTASEKVQMHVMFPKISGVQGFLPFIVI